jgi:chromosome partitioning protein
MSKQNPDFKLLGFLPMMDAEHIRQHRIVTGDVARQFGVPKSNINQIFSFAI